MQDGLLPPLGSLYFKVLKIIVRAINVKKVNVKHN